MILTVKNESPFQILSSSFSIGPSETGYELQVGADSSNFTTLFSVGANTPRMVTNVANGSYFRLKNNVGDVKVNWQRVCVTEGGEGGSGTELQPVADFPLNAVEGTVISYTGSSSASGVYQYDGENWTEVGADIDLSAFWTSAETKTYVDSAVTDTQNQLNEISGMMQSKELVISTAFNQLSDEIDELSGRSVDLSGYYTSAQTEEAISAATSGKADKANVLPNYGALKFPAWNADGIIGGEVSTVHASSNFYLNGTKREPIFSRLVDAETRIDIYAPQSAGNAGDILVSAGANQAPVWSAVTMPDMSEYTPTSGFSTINGSAITNGGDIVIQGGADMSAYYTSAQTEDAISAATDDMKTYTDNRIDGYDSAVTLTWTPQNQPLKMNGSNVYEADEVGWEALGLPWLYTTNMQQYDLGNAPGDPNLGRPNYVKFKYVGEANDIGFTGVYYALPADGEFVEGVPVQLTRTTVEPETVYTTPALTAGTGDFIWDNVNLTITWKRQPVIEQHIPGVVKSDGVITKVQKLTQAEYDAITTKDPSTFYIIVNN